MNTALKKTANAYFQQRFGIGLDALMAPIADGAPTGQAVAGQGIYSAIREARRSDDASLPMGTWEHELKQADWDRVARIASEALVKKCKDLQLAAWLLESQINQTGFAGIAPCLLLMQGLCETYWDGLYPLLEGSDGEHRANIIRWATQKLLPALRQVPITDCGGPREYAWSDWEVAHRNDHLRAQGAASEGGELEGPTLKEITAAMYGTPVAAYLALSRTLQEAQEGISAFRDTLDLRFGQDGPSLRPMADLVDTLKEWTDAELRRRGASQLTPSPAANDAATEVSPSSRGRPSAGASPSAPGDESIRDRAAAYRQLAEIADFMQRIEPHSPTPYLIRRAIQWGSMNTAELYQELFMRLGGQINIFELLGLQTEEAPPDA